MGKFGDVVIQTTDTQTVNEKGLKSTDKGRVSESEKRSTEKDRLSSSDKGVFSDDGLLSTNGNVSDGGLPFTDKGLCNECGLRSPAKGIVSESGVRPTDKRISSQCELRSADREIYNKYGSQCIDEGISSERRLLSSTNGLVSEDGLQTTHIGICSECVLLSNEKGILSGNGLRSTDRRIYNDGRIQTSTKSIGSESRTQATNKSLSSESGIQATNKSLCSESGIQATNKCSESGIQATNKCSESRIQATYKCSESGIQATNKCSESGIRSTNKGIFKEGVLQTSTIGNTNTVTSTVPLDTIGSGATTSVGDKFKLLGHVYSKATGTFAPSWRTGVNLSPPKSFTEQIPDGDKHIRDYYNSLQYTLLETGYAETVDRTDAPRTRHNDEQVTVAIMSSPCECIGLLLEGGERLPDGFHLILSPSWISQEPSRITTTTTSPSTMSNTTNQTPSLNTLYVHKAITFHKNGQTFIEEFAVPRRVTYLVNFFTHGITGGQRNDGQRFETEIDCPISSPIPLAAIVDDKVWTRSIMADVGMAIPETLAFMYRPLYDVISSTDKIRIVNVFDRNNVRLDEMVGTFLMGDDMARANKVVVKPSGPGVCGSMGVSYHGPQEVTSVCDAVRDLLQEIKPGSSILVERFIDTLNRNRKDGRRNPEPWHADERYGFRLRTTVCRDFNDTPVTTMVNCGIALKSEPISGDNTVTQTLNNTLLAFGVADVQERQQLEMQVRQQSEDVLRGIIEGEKQFDERSRGAVLGQTDVIGIDMCVEDQDGRLVPCGIEVNSHDCIINCQIYDFIQALYKRTVSSTRVLEGLSTQSHENSLIENLNRTYQPWIQNMVTRSQLYLMQGKCVLVIGAGGYSKRYIWTAAATYGIKIVLVDCDVDNSTIDAVRQYIWYDLKNHTQDEYHAKEISAILRNLNITPDGCLTFWEDCGPLAALIREELGLGQGASYKAALNGKKKSRTQEILRSRKDDTPHWPRAYLYSSPTYRLEDDTLTDIAERINYPVILKLEHGSSAVGVFLVQNPAELIHEYTKTTSFLQCEEDFPGVGLGHDNSMVVMEYHQGSEHDVDVVIFDRQLVAAFISDNGPTRVPLFTETTSVMPSTLPEDKQAQLVVAAYQCCTELGLTHGVFNVELNMTPTGPKLIEINARMGGFYLRDWIKRLYGIDMVLLSMMVACGIKPFVPKCPPQSYMMGIMLVPSLHEDIPTCDAAGELIESGEVVLNEFSELAHSDSDLFEEPFAHISVKGRSVSEAKDKLIRVCEELHITREDYNVEEFLRDF